MLLTLNPAVARQEWQNLEKEIIVFSAREPLPETYSNACIIASKE